MRIILNFLQDFSDLHIEALQVVANCLNDSESFQLIHQGGGLTRLTEFIITPNITEIQSCAVKCIARVAQSGKQKRKQKDNNFLFFYYKFGNRKGTNLTFQLCV